MSLRQFDDIPKHKTIQAVPAPQGPEHSPIVIVGAGPVGLTLALDLGQRGHRVVLLNQFDFIPGGSKAICFGKRTLDIWNRLGVASRMVEKGVVWNIGKVFHGANPDPVFEFDMLSVKDQQMPGFINLQQYYAEEFLLDAIEALDNVEIRWGHQICAFEQIESRLLVKTHERTYEFSADWIVACDGSRSKMRELMNLDFEGRIFEDNFLIADVKFQEERPSERWFWFDPPWGGASALLHKQPDNVWRLDFQLGWDVDREAAIKPENVEPYVEGMIGPDVPFSEEWYSIYTFQCRRMQRFVHGNVIFAGDSAHLVSPFGARGCNGGIADVDNLAWKLDAVLGGADVDLIETYNQEAIVMADENILNSTRSTDFMTPKSAHSQTFRDAVLDLAREHEFARPFINSGRLSTAVSFPDSPLCIPDEDVWGIGVSPGSPAIDAPTGNGWLLQNLGREWKLLAVRPLDDAKLPVVLIGEEAAKERYGLENGGAYLVRPDQYIAARWKHFQPDKLEALSWTH